MAGVSLVADAAEQLERVTNSENCTFAQDMHSFNGKIFLLDLIDSHSIPEPILASWVIFYLLAYLLFAVCSRSLLSSDWRNSHADTREVKTPIVSH